MVSHPLYIFIIENWRERTSITKLFRSNNNKNKIEEQESSLVYSLVSPRLASVLSYFKLCESVNAEIKCVCVCVLRMCKLLTCLIVCI